VRSFLVFVAVLGLAGAVAVVVLRRPAPPPPPVAVAPAVPAEDAGLTSEEVFAASMARLAEARRKAEEDAAAEVDAGRRMVEVTPDPRLPPATGVYQTGPSTAPQLETVAALLRDQDLAGALEQVHALYRTRSPAAPRALELLTHEIQALARAGDLPRVEPVLPRLQELPTSEAPVRSHVARALGSVALASSKAGQTERSRQEARAALALDESTPEAYLALGEFMFQGNDLAGALDTWEHGLRLNPGNVALARRLERGRSEAQRLGGMERVTSEHFSVAFDGRADVPGARASLEVMEAAYRSVGGLFELYPDGPIPVVLYPDRSFEQEGHVSWSAGVYDGKIRLPSAGANATSLRFRGVLFHEYAHALFHRATGGKGGPAWLNEGYADVAKLVGDPGPAVRCTPDVHSFQLRALEQSFGRIGSHRQAHLAYLEARHAVEHILDRHGQAGVRSLLSELSTGVPFATAFERALHQDYATFAAAFDAEASR
jgi:tetratricopeptide (TPR) repeat protein